MSSFFAVKFVGEAFITLLVITKTNVAFVPMGTPLLAGPGAIVATMLFVRRAQTGPELAAFLAAIGSFVTHS